MPQLFTHISWLHILLFCFLVVVIYYLLSFVLFTPWIRTIVGEHGTIRRLRDHLYWPIAGVIIAGLLIMKSPVAHGFMIIVILLLSWKYIREIFLGAFLKFSQIYQVDQPYHVDGRQAKLVALDVIGAKFKFSAGTQFLSYSQLLDSKAVALADDVTSDEITFRCENRGDLPMTRNDMMELIFDCPYVDHYHKPQIEVIDENTMIVRVNTKYQVTSEKLISYFSKKKADINFRITQNTF